MGKKLTVYLNDYYYNLFEELKEKIREDKGVEINNTDLIRLALLSLKEKILKED